MQFGNCKWERYRILLWTMQAFIVPFRHFRGNLRLWHIRGNWQKRALMMLNWFLRNRRCLRISYGLRTAKKLFEPSYSESNWAKFTVLFLYEKVMSRKRPLSHFLRTFLIALKFGMHILEVLTQVSVGSNRPQNSPGCQANSKWPRSNGASQSSNQVILHGTVRP